MHFLPTCRPRGHSLPMKKKPWCISKLHTSIPNDKNFDMSELKTFADAGFSPEIFEGVVALSSWVVLQMLLKVLPNFK